MSAPVKNTGPPQETNVILIGESSIGKTNLLGVFAGERFDPSSMATVGIDYRKRKCKPTNQTANPIDLTFWDTAG